MKEVAIEVAKWIVRHSKIIGVICGGVSFLLYALVVISEGDLPEGLFVLFTLLVIYILTLEVKLNNLEKKTALLYEFQSATTELLVDMQKAIVQFKDELLPDDVRNKMVGEVFKQVMDDIDNITDKIADSMKERMEDVRDTLIEVVGNLRSTVDVTDAVKKTVKKEAKDTNFVPKTNFKLWRKG